MSNLYDLVMHYPWLPSLKNYYKDSDSKTPTEFIQEIFQEDTYNTLHDRLLILFKAAFENLENVSIYKIDKINISLYLSLRILLEVLNDKPISYRIANLYSKITYDELNKENDSNLYTIYKDLGLNVIYDETPMVYKLISIKEQHSAYTTNFKLHFIDYLKLASNLKDDYRKLVNNALSNGYIYLKQESINRLIQEYVRKKFLEETDHSATQLETLKKNLCNIPEFKSIYDNILSDWELKKEKFEYSFEIGYKEGKDISPTYPPCMMEILSKAEQGQNLQHSERLIILFFLTALEYPNEKIVDLFSKMPDFDRNKTEYQVNFAKKKKYTPHACSTIKSLNLCMAKDYNDNLCLNGYFSNKLQEQRYIRHPLFYVQFKQFKSLKGQKVENKKISNKNE